MYTNFLIWLLLTPLLLSLIAFVLRWLKITSIRLAEVLHGINISLVLVFALIVLQGVLSDGHVGALNNWLLVDSLGVLFLMIIAVVGFLVGLYSIGYIRHEVETGELSEQQVHFYYALLSLFCFTMLLVVTSNNIIMMWVAVEATTLGSAFLVGIYNRRSSLEAAWKYVMICTVGVAFGLYGTILVYSDAVNYLQEPGAAILWTAIVENAAALDPTLLKLAFVFILIGFGTKAGIFPMHAWLPDAHSESPSPVSALLSAVLLKCALLVILRFAIILNHGVGPEFVQNIFIIFGMLSVGASALFIFVQKDIKRLLAYSSVENIGLIVLGLGIGGALGTVAALFHAINHSLVKSLLFCITGNVLMKYKTRDLQKISGIIQAAPITGFLLLIGGLALIGSPPFNIFLSKFGIISAGFRSGHLWIMIACLLFLAIIFAGFVRVLSSSVFGSLSEDITSGDFRFSSLAPLLVLVVLILILGLYLPPQLEILLNQATTIAASGASQTLISDLSISENTFIPVILMESLFP